MVVATVALLSVGLLRSGTATADHLAITSGSGEWQVTVIDQNASAADLIAELRSAGISVETDERPVGPSRVGHTLSTAFTGLSNGDTITIPAGAPVTIEVGVATPPGVEYATPSNAFDPGEPLHCLGHVGSDAAALAARIPVGVDVEWFRGLSDTTQITDLELTGTIVALASSTRADTVRVNVVDGTGPLDPPSC